MALPINLVPLPVTIASGTALSPAAALGAYGLHGIAMPSAWTAADLTFQVSADGGATWLEMSDVAGAAIDYKAAASVYIPIDPTLWRAVNMIRVRSGTSGAAVNQGADRVLTLILRPIA